MRSAAPAMRDDVRVERAEGALGRWLPLVLVSAVSLFLELAVIRWISAEVRLFAYFKNLPLLAAFLGLGIGFGLVGRGRDWRPAFGPLLAVFAGMVLAVANTSPIFLAYPGSGDEFLFYTVSPTVWVAAARFLGLVVALFLLVMLLFVPLGQATGEEMARHEPLPAYVANIVASLGGVWAFTLLSFLETPPVVWLGVGLLGFAVYLRARGGLGRATMVAFVVVLAAVALVGRRVVWSPYQRLQVGEVATPAPGGGRVKLGYSLDVQRVFFQQAVDFSPEFLASLGNRVLSDMAASYELPYRLRPPGARVLVVGAGMGNDAAAALRAGASHVDAVEIDPAILALGRTLHPERPYDDPKLTTIVADARAFFKRTADRYDVIAFGLLDSHTLLSGLSSVRLDSFVYTLESFREVRRHLADGGIVAVTFAHSPPWVIERLGRMLEEVFGTGRVFVRSGWLGTTLVAGVAAPDTFAAAGLASWHADPEAGGIPLATDDWPYLYLRGRIMPAAYWQMFLVVGAACLLLIARFFPAALRPEWHFWLLGAGFLLVEFKSITEMALLFGTTWLVNALAISGVLVMVLAANLVSLRRPRFHLPAVYVLLFASLALAWVFPLDALNALAPAARAALAMVLLSLPIFFAGLIFAQALRDAGETARPLASNLCGAVAGGVLEYGSLWWGIKSLYLIAALVYAGALAASRLRRG